MFADFGNVLSVLLCFSGPLGRFRVSFRGSIGHLGSSYNPSGSSSFFLDSGDPLECFSDQRKCSSSL